MQDPRIRLGSTVLLSLAAFISIPGAILSAFWWLICTGRTTSFHDIRTLSLVFILPVIAACATSLSGGDGGSYLIRISAVLLVASWAYSERYPGEFLDVSVWLLGKKSGFDIGLIGEMSLSSAEVLIDEIRRTRIALRQKGQHLSLSVLPPVMTSLLVRQLRLAHERAGVLAMRGYRGGGSLCPVFRTPYRDIGAGALCILIFVVSLFPETFFKVSG
jgi:energy-coupling factor transport system permease protein